MSIKGNTVLITDGATGIGFALSDAFLKAGNTVIICGRRKEQLEAAKSKLPGVHTFVCDVTKSDDRLALFNWVLSVYPNLNILVNNAGVQRMVNLKLGDKELPEENDEIETNLVAPIYLSALFIPRRGYTPHGALEPTPAAIINVSSALGFVPIAGMPVYCATKAALHSFTVSLRHQLKDTPIKVFEIVPPMVATEPGGQEIAAARGIAPSALATEVLAGIASDKFELPIGEAAGLIEGACTDFEATFQRLNRSS